MPWEGLWRAHFGKGEGNREDSPDWAEKGGTGLQKSLAQTVGKGGR